MKKSIFFCGLCATMILLSSCSIPYKKPQGTWKSDSPDITITFPERSNQESLGTAIMELNGEEEEIFCFFGYDPMVEILPLSALHDSGIHDDECYFKGEIGWDGDKLLLIIFSSHLDDLPNDTTITFSPQENASTHRDRMLPWFLEDMLNQ